MLLKRVECQIEADGKSALFVEGGIVQMIPRRKFVVADEMVRTEGFGNLVFLIQPLTQIEKSAALGAERAEARLKPGAAFGTGGAFDVLKVGHFENREWRRRGAMVNRFAGK